MLDVVTYRAYDVLVTHQTISDPLPSGLTYLSATPAPMLVAPQANGTTLILWNNIADLEANESLTVSLTASLGARRTASRFIDD